MGSEEFIAAPEKDIVPFDFNVKDKNVICAELSGFKKKEDEIRWLSFIIDQLNSHQVKLERIKTEAGDLIHAEGFKEDGWYCIVSLDPLEYQKKIKKKRKSAIGKEKPIAKNIEELQCINPEANVCWYYVNIHTVSIPFIVQELNKLRNWNTYSLILEEVSSVTNNETMENYEKRDILRRMMKNLIEGSYHSILDPKSNSFGQLVLQLHHTLRSIEGGKDQIAVLLNPQPPQIVKEVELLKIRRERIKKLIRWENSYSELDKLINLLKTKKFIRSKQNTASIIYTHFCDTEGDLFTVSKSKRESIISDSISYNIEDDFPTGNIEPIQWEGRITQICYLFFLLKEKECWSRKTYAKKHWHITNHFISTDEDQFNVAVLKTTFSKHNLSKFDVKKHNPLDNDDNSDEDDGHNETVDFNDKILDQIIKKVFLKPSKTTV